MENHAKRPRLRHRFLVGSVVMATNFLTPNGAASTLDVLPPHSVKIIAHRGGTMNRPENTMPAFRHAVGLGAEIIEFDMQMTADDQIAIYHDVNINPNICSSDSASKVVGRAVRTLDYADIRKLDCGSRARPAFARTTFVAIPGASVPSLDEVLAGLADSRATLFAETKIPKPSTGANDIDPLKFVTMVNEAVQKYGLEDRFVLQSFDYRTIDAMHEVNPRIRTCLQNIRVTISLCYASTMPHASLCRTATSTRTVSISCGKPGYWSFQVWWIVAKAGNDMSTWVSMLSSPTIQKVLRIFSSNPQ